MALCLWFIMFLFFYYYTMTTNRKEYAKAYYKAHKEQIQSYQREYHKRKMAEKKANPWLLDTRVDYKTPTREAFQAIPKSISSYNKEYYEKNKERIRAQQKEARERKKRLNYQREYYSANRERILEQQRKYWKKKREEAKLSKTFWGRIKLKIRKFFN